MSYRTISDESSNLINIGGLGEPNLLDSIVSNDFQSQEPLKGFSSSKGVLLP
jgi:hypothetical protein